MFCFLFLLLDFVVSWHLKTSVKITFDAVFAYSRQILLFAFSQGLPVGIYAYAGPHGRCCLARHSKLGLSSLANENFRFPKFISSAKYSSVEWFQATKRESNIILRGMERWGISPNRTVKQNQGWNFHLPQVQRWWSATTTSPPRSFVDNSKHVNCNTSVTSPKLSVQRFEAQVYRWLPQVRVTLKSQTRAHTWMTSFYSGSFSIGFSRFFSPFFQWSSHHFSIVSTCSGRRAIIWQCQRHHSCSSLVLRMLGI